MVKVLTFDLGTTYFKVCLFDDDAKLVARSRVAVPVQRPTADRAELPVAAFCRVLAGAVQDVSRQVNNLRDVSRIGFSTQANSFTLLDERSEPLLPFLLWTDRRARDTVDPLIDLMAQPEFFSLTGVAELDHLFLTAKFHWLHRFQPQIVSRARRLCCIGDYLVWWLTGNHLTEAGAAGLTGLVDIHRLLYRADALRRIELPIEWLPEILRAGREAGPIRSERIEEWGLAEDCRLSMGCLDQYAGAIGAGNTQSGGVSETTGTVLATVHCTDSWSDAHRPGVFRGPSFAEGMYYEMVFSELSAGVLERYRNALPDRPSFAELDMMASAVPAGAEGLRLQQDAARRSAEDMFLNRTAKHHRGHEVRTILEAVACELNRQVKLLCGEYKPAVVRAAGGGANSKLWLKIKSDTLDCPVQAVDCPEPTSLGAAMLALGRIG
jgi:xylulokinase